MMKKVSLLGLCAALVLLLTLLSGGEAMAQILLGTTDNDTILGTNDPDHIDGFIGNDTLKGRAANDTYHFDNGFGTDRVIETATVGTQELPGARIP
jgi:Ca2+-binding RTX toxin-like protein